MSDTDNTDILVQIPPNIFHVHSSPSDDSFNIDSTRTVVRRTPKSKFEAINDLVTHVSQLEFRIENLEVTSNSARNCSATKSVPNSCFMHSLSPKRISQTTDFDRSFPSRQESKCYTFPRRKRKKQVKKSSLEFHLKNARASTLCESFNYKRDNFEDYYPIIPNLNTSTAHSLKSTSEFDFRLSLNSNESHTMDGDISSIASSPEKKDDKYVMKEIDTFLDKVEMYEGSMSMQNSRNTEPTRDRTSVSTSLCKNVKQDLCNADNEFKLPSGRMVTADFLDKYRYLKEKESDIPEKTEPFHYLERKYEGNPQKLLSDDSSGYQQIRYTPTKDTFKVPLEKDRPQLHVNRKLEFVASESGMKFHPTSTPKQPIPNEVIRSSMIGQTSFKPSCSRLSERATNIMENKKSVTGCVNHFLESDVSMQKETPFKKKQSSDCRSRELINRAPSYTSRLSSVQETQNSSPKHGFAKDSERNVFPIPTTESNNTKAKPGNIENIYQNLGNYDESQVSSMVTRGAELPDINLISLSDLWGNHEVGDTNFNIRKLEEEKLKREHCEDLIQQLQKKLLDQQERLAVAIRVDAAKDVAVGKLRASWLRIQQHLNDAEGRHKNMMERMTMEITNLRTKTTEAEEKTKQYEDELHKALDLAHGYQEKYKEVNVQRLNEQEEHKKDMEQLKEDNERQRKEMEELRENNTSIMRLNKQFTDCIQKLEDTIEKEKNAHESTKVQVSTMSTTLECTKNEMTILESERDTLREKVREEQARNAGLAQKLVDIQDRFTSAKKREESFESEVSALRKQIEVQKNDLKIYYQKQLEEAVLAKLREFQGQLDAAERQMEQEMRDKEQNIAEGFARRLYKAEEQHKLEISLLEEKQGEESKLHRLQLAQAVDKISALENKLDSFRSRRGQIASQLHHVMENQWKQALHILTNQGTSPDISAATLARLDSEMSNSRNMATSEDRSIPTKPSLNHQSVESHRSASTLLRRQDRKESDVEPLLSDAELQHYVKMLLTKPPSFIDSSSESVRPRHREPSACIEEPTSDRTRPNQDLDFTDRADSNRNTKYTDRARSNRDSYDRAGPNRDPHDRAGPNREQHDRAEPNRDSYERAGPNRDPYDRAGLNQDSYDRAGPNRDPYDRAGPNRDPYDRAGLNQDSYDRAGPNRDPYDRAGPNRQHPANHSQTKNDEIYTERSRTSVHPEQYYSEQSRARNEQGSSSQDKGKGQNKSRDSISYTGKPPWKC